MAYFTNIIHQHRINRRIFEYTLAFGFAAILGNLAVDENKFPLTISILAMGVTTYFYPILLIIIHFLATILPMTLAKCFEDQRTWGITFDQIGIGDIVYGVMLAHLIIRILTGGAFLLVKRTAFPTDARLGILLLVLWLWFLFGILRNFDVYGLSAAGEFRNHYIYLIVPIYIAAFFNAPRQRKNLFTLTLICSLWIPLICVPAIGMVKGWHIGADSRFFPAEISFGILHGALFGFLAHRYGYVKIPGPVLWLSGLAASVMIIIDTHRSVWVPSVVMFLSYLWLTRKQIRLGFEKMLGYAGLGIFTFYLASQIVSLQLGQDLTEFIAERGKDAFIMDTSYASTWTWRIQRWQMELEKVAASPFTGVGFGAYWGDIDLLEKDPIFPHNLYVQILIKLGIIGLVLYGLLIFRVFQRIAQAMGNGQGAQKSEFVILLSGLIALIGSHVHYLAYSFDPYSLFFIGLAMAIIQAGHTTRSPWGKRISFV